MNRIACLTLAGLVAVAGCSLDGLDGKDGRDGAACQMVDNGDGSQTLRCDDGSSTLIRDGADGRDGANGSPGADGRDGTPCTVTDLGNGQRRLQCGDAVDVILDGQDGSNGVDGRDGTDGRDGQDGSSCTVTTNTDGSQSIRCGDGSWALVYDGVDGADGGGCTTTDNGDGSTTIACVDGTSWVVNHGATGTAGTDGTGCSLTNSNGTATLNCGTGVTVSWQINASGSFPDCSVADLPNGRVSLTCGNGFSFTWDPRICTQNAYICSGQQMMQCSSNGRSISYRQTCPTGLACQASTGTCANPSNVRLQGGSSAAHGVLQVQHNGTWDEVCDDGWEGPSSTGLTNAGVVCRELGFTGVSTLNTSWSVSDSTFWLDNVVCSGSEQSLVNCSANSWGDENCGSTEGIWIDCI